MPYNLYETTLAQLIERIGRLSVKEWKEGTFSANATATTSMTDTKRREANDYFQNTSPVSRLYVISTLTGVAPMGEEREFTDWTQTGGIGVLAPAFTASLPAGGTYCILAEYSWAEIREAINMALDEVARIALVDKVDSSSITLQAGVYEYPVPSGFTRIYRIIMADANENFYNSPIPHDQYRIVRGLDVPAIRFERMPAELQLEGHMYSELWASASLTAGRKLQVEGFQRQPELVNPFDVCYVNPAYVVAQAAAYLHMTRIRRPENEPDAHREQYDAWQRKADRAKGDIAYAFPPNTKLVSI